MNTNQILYIVYALVGPHLQRSPTKKLVPSFLEKYDDRYCNIPNEHAKFTQNVSYENMKIVQNSIYRKKKSMKKDVSFE